MTRLDLAKARELCEQATEGPWTYDGATGEINGPHDGPAGPVLDAGGLRERDARFCAAARSLVPALIAEVERLTQELAEVREFKGVTKWADDVRMSAKYAKENEHLRALLDEAVGIAEEWIGFRAPGLDTFADVARDTLTALRSSGKDSNADR